MSQETIGIIGQYGSMSLLVVGLAIEIVMEAHVGFIFLTAGSLLWGLSTKVRGK